MPNDKIIELIQKGDPQEFGGAERLKGLMRVIPEKDEVWVKVSNPLINHKFHFIYSGYKTKDS